MTNPVYHSVEKTKCHMKLKRVMKYLLWGLPPVLLFAYFVIAVIYTRSAVWNYMDTTQLPKELHAFVDCPYEDSPRGNIPICKMDLNRDGTPEILLGMEPTIGTCDNMQILRLGKDGKYHRIGTFFCSAIYFFLPSLSRGNAMLLYKGPDESGTNSKLRMLYFRNGEYQ